MVSACWPGSSESQRWIARCGQLWASLIWRISELAMLRLEYWLAFGLTFGLNFVCACVSTRVLFALICLLDLSLTVVSVSVFV